MSNWASANGFPLLRVSRAARYSASRSIRSASCRWINAFLEMNFELWAKNLRNLKDLVYKTSAIRSIHSTPCRTEFECSSSCFNGGIHISLWVIISHWNYLVYKYKYLQSKWIQAKLFYKQNVEIDKGKVNTLSPTATSHNFLPVDGLITANFLPETESTNLPSMNNFGWP